MDGKIAGVIEGEVVKGPVDRCSVLSGSGLDGLIRRYKVCELSPREKRSNSTSVKDSHSPNHFPNPSPKYPDLQTNLRTDLGPRSEAQHQTLLTLSVKKDVIRRDYSPNKAILLGLFRGRELLLFLSKTVEAAPISRTILEGMRSYHLRSEAGYLLVVIILHVDHLVRRRIDRIERVEAHMWI